MTGNRQGGFTLVEILVVMVIIGTLLTLAVPRYFHAIERSKEAVLKQDLATLRESIDKFYGDTGSYPATLDLLVAQHYLRRVPVDPLAESADKWVSVLDDEPEDNGIKDVHSGAEGIGEDGLPYASW
jgi:general secretion pathway protein G